ncbi:MAG: hypothetical protein M1829_005250 [Trizodia sp. TS-e1964]|nr:MAG: hypothetical protein M1829_005250 [Trizodia sp. TS-e1964]
MSFGFGVGDFLAVINLTNKIRKEFMSAPSQFGNISDEVRSLSIIINDVDVVLSDCELSPKQQTELKEIASSCHKVLGDLEKTLEKYNELQTHGGNLGKKVKRVWKQLKWEPEDIQELRNRISSNVSLLNTYVTRISSQATFATKIGVDRLNERQDDQARLDILNWLTPIDYAPQQNDLICKREPGTGQWLLDSLKFKTWLQADNQTLLCHGLPGSGKTMLTSIVVNELITRFENDRSIGVAYIYFNFRQLDEQKVADLIANLLRQLVQDRPSLPEDVNLLYNKNKSKHTKPPLEESLKALHSVASTYSRIFIIIDALDECQTSNGCRSQFLSKVFNLQARSRANIFATSRSIPEITERFEGSFVIGDTC